MRSCFSRLVAATLSLALVATACGGGTEDAGNLAVGDPEIQPASPAAAETAETAEPGAPEPAAAPATTEPVAPTEVPSDVAPPAQTGESEADAAIEPTAPPAPAAVAVSLPAVQVVDLATDEMKDLSGFSRPGATLVWFWAPH